MKLHRFTRRGMLFIPKNFFGLMILIAAIVYAVYVFIDIDSRSHSVSDTLMNFVFNLFLISVVYSLIAILTSQSKS